MLDLRLALPDDARHQAVGDTPVFIKCVSPEHHDKKRPNMAVYPDHLHCYGCGFHRALEGDGLAGHEHPLATLLGCSEREAVVAAARYTNESLDAYRERAAEEARRDPLPMALADAYHSLLLGLRAHRLEVLYARGLTDDTLDGARLGHNGFQFTVPVLDADGQLLTIRFRRDDEYGTKRPKYMGLAGRNGLYLYGEAWLGRAETVVVCEGELDALLLWQHRVPAVSPTNGAGQVSKVPAMLHERFPHVQSLLIATDQDEPGMEAARLTLEAAAHVGLSARRLSWPEEFKDVTEYRQGDPAGFRATFSC